MKRFAIRIVIASFVFNCVVVAQADEPTDEDVKVRLQPLKIEQGDSELRKLQKERFSLSIDVVQSLMARFHSGADAVPFFVEAQQRMIAAGLELEIDQKARVAILEEGLRLAKITEQALKSEVEAGKAVRWKADYASYARADLQIRLLKEKASKRQ